MTFDAGAVTKARDVSRDANGNVDFTQSGSETISFTQSGAGKAATINTNQRVQYDKLVANVNTGTANFTISRNQSSVSQISSFTPNQSATITGTPRTNVTGWTLNASFTNIPAVQNTQTYKATNLVTTEQIGPGSFYTSTSTELTGNVTSMQIYMHVNGNDRFNSRSNATLYVKSSQFAFSPYTTKYVGSTISPGVNDSDTLDTTIQGSYSSPYVEFRAYVSTTGTETADNGFDTRSITAYSQQQQASATFTAFRNQVTTVS